ncbi:hypothetical protein N7E81_12455 [Reichenbachiella carrageenanivorans]|uniref:Uncharacterized protein n=1 Tax=Reichenbachiella carrageenanivorans TaxID=2979869 RepID=A0ABY6CW79_9BACT|nr:hypothetical protein [Reichenbachiella carrageenanivorans]UXX78171.1 hypothetical protein N7E81_12455 [Reichenbachiella carrageenanivorans]
MKRSLFITMNCLVGFALFAQDISDNGKNLHDICPAETCTYITFTSTIYFPFEEDKQWEIRNMEIATKKSGHFMATGDLYVHGLDTGAALSLELVFISEDDKELYRQIIPEFEFYNEPTGAEPFFMIGQMDEELASVVSYVDVDINGSRRMPYYEIASDCYHACKEHQLNEALKTFRKAK